MSTKATVGKSDAQNNKHVSGEAAGSKHPTSHAELGPEIEIIPDMSGAKTVVEKKGVSAGISGTKPDLFLDQLRVDVTGTIIVMIGRVWDVSAVSGRYLRSDDSLLCTGQRCSQFSTAKERRDIFSDKFCGETQLIIKDDNFMLEFDGSTTFKRVSVKADGFVRYPLNLLDFDAIKPVDNKYLIDVAGYVSNVGRTNHLKSGSKNLVFQLANHRGQSIRVTLWGNLEEVLVKKKLNRLFAFSDKVHLLSTSSTMILDDAEIPAIKALKDAISGVELENPYTPIDLTRPVKGTIKNLLMWARNRKKNSATFHCTVTINGVRTKTGWNFPSCGSEGCRKGATRQKGYFFCESCNRRVDFPMLRYMLELDVSDVTAQTVVVLFDKPATALSADDHVGLPPAISNLIGTTHVMEIKSQSYYKYGTFESFTCWQLNPEEVCADSVGSNTLDALDGVQTHRLSRPVRAPTVATPQSLQSPKEQRAWSLRTPMLRVVTEVSSEDVSGNTPQDDNMDRPVSRSDKKKGLAYADASSE
ncbi:replication protein A 70 kDa DNA-binding subunit C-like protein [Tanacetum coccineum]